MEKKHHATGSTPDSVEAPERYGLEPRMLTLGEAARLTGVSPRQFHNLAATGLAPFGVHISRSRRWNSQVLASWMAGGCKPVEGARDGQ